MKKLLAVLLALTLAFSSLACALPTKLTAKDKQTETTKKEAAAVEEVAEDYSELFGAWKLKSSTGDKVSVYSSTIWDGYAIFTHDGKCAFFNSYSIRSNSIERLIDNEEWYTVDGNTMVSSLSKSKAFTENISYELSKKLGKETLVVNVEELEKDGPTKTIHREAKLTYVRDNEATAALYEYSLLGKWTDNYDNNWEFTQGKAANSSLYYTFVKIVDSTGGTYEPKTNDGVDISVSDNGKVLEVEFRFKDYITIQAEIVSFDGNVLEMTQDDGSSLVLTRVVGK